MKYGVIAFVVVGLLNMTIAIPHGKFLSQCTQTLPDQANKGHISPEEITALLDNFKNIKASLGDIADKLQLSVPGADATVVNVDDQQALKAASSDTP